MPSHTYILKGFKHFCHSVFHADNGLKKGFSDFERFILKQENSSYISIYEQQLKKKTLLITKNITISKVQMKFKPFF